MKMFKERVFRYQREPGLIFYLGNKFSFKANKNDKQTNCTLINL